MSRTLSRILTGRKQTSWLLTCVAKGFELGATEKQTQVVVRVELEPGIRLTTRPNCRYAWISQDSFVNCHSQLQTSQWVWALPLGSNNISTIWVPAALLLINDCFRKPIIKKIQSRMIPGIVWDCAFKTISKTRLCAQLFSYALLVAH